MSTITISGIEEKIRREQWTAISVEKITANDIQEMDATLQEIDGDETREEVLEIFHEQLKQNPKSILALFGTAIVYLYNRSVDDTHIVQLLDMFKQAKRWGLLEVLCNRFLEFGENRILLKELSNCYEQLGDTGKQLATWERLIRVDFKEIEVVEKLAKIYQDQGESEKATDYYKKYLLRGINARDFNSVQSAWNQLINIGVRDIDFYLQVATKVASSIGVDQSVLMLEGIYPTCKQRNEWDNAIILLKQIFELQPDNVWARKELIVCYEQKYAQHSNLENFIKSSNIAQSWRNIREAIADFEKHISFDEQNFVFHRSWGVGVIRKIENDIIYIDFSKAKQHEMSLKMALTALEVLPKNHIWVLRSMVEPNKLKKMVKENVAWTLKIIIGSFGNAVSLKRVRKELVPYVLNESEWANWNIKARKILKTDGIFGTVADMPEHFEVRTQRSSTLEKIYNSFMAEKKFNNRAKIAFELLKTTQKNLQGSDIELLREIWEYFIGFVNSRDQEPVLRISSLLLVEWMANTYGELGIDPGSIQASIADIVTDSNNALAIYQQIDNKNIRQLFLQAIADKLDDDIWVPTYTNILRGAPSKILLDKLHDSGYTDKANTVIKNISTNYRNNREAFVWLLAHQEQYEWLKDNLPDDTQATIAMAHLFDINNAVDIANKRNMVAARRLQRQIYRFLYTSGNLDTLIESAEESVIAQIIPILNEIQKIEPSITIKQKSVIRKRFPELLVEEYDSQAGSAVGSSGDRFLTLDESYHKRQEELRHLHEVEVPANSREIQKAVEMGDLRENAEYKSAKEHQEILNAKAMRLEQEIARAVIFDPKTIDSTVVGFGCTVKLSDIVNKKDIAYTILGPWESDPDNGIISYQSPLGVQLRDHNLNEKLDFEINNIKHKYQINAIEYNAAQQS